MKMNPIKKTEAISFMEGSEYCREYVKSSKLTFGTSELPPGARGDKDPGHKVSQEIFYVCKGHVLLFVEEDDKYYELYEGDCILIPEGVSHTLINVGDIKALITWTMAPSTS